ncbi:MAG: hypothetical protein ACRD3D_14580 [Terriglobia bacterium]
MADAPFDSRQAVRDGRMVTPQMWQSHPEFYRGLFACLREAGSSAQASTAGRF